METPGQRVDSLAPLVALRHHDVRVVGSIPGLGSFNTVTLTWVIQTKADGMQGFSMFPRPNILFFKVPLKQT